MGLTHTTFPGSSQADRGTEGAFRGKLSCHSHRCGPWTQSILEPFKERLCQNSVRWSEDCPAHSQSAGVEHPRPGPTSSEGLLSKVLPPLTQRRPWSREEKACSCGKYRGFGAKKLSAPLLISGPTEIGRPIPTELISWPPSPFFVPFHTRITYTVPSCSFSPAPPPHPPSTHCPRSFPSSRPLGPGDSASPQPWIFPGSPGRQAGGEWMEFFCSLPPSPLPPAPTFFSAKPSILCTRLEGGGQCVLSLHNQDPHLQIKGSEWGEVLKSCLQLITVCAVSLPRPEPGRGGSHRKFCGPIIIKPHVATRDWILLCQPQMEAYPPAPSSPSPLPPHLAFQASPLVPSTPNPHPQPHPAPASSLFSSILVRSLASIYLVHDTSFLLPSLPVLCPLVVRGGSALHNDL